MIQELHYLVQVRLDERDWAAKRKIPVSAVPISVCVAIDNAVKYATNGTAEMIVVVPLPAESTT